MLKRLYAFRTNFLRRTAHHLYHHHSITKHLHDGIDDGKEQQYKNNFSSFHSVVADHHPKRKLIIGNPRTVIICYY